MRMKGYMGTLLRVNVGTRQIIKEDLNMQWAADFIGGTGLGVRIAYDEIPPTCDPLGPENKLIFMTGPVTATMLGTSGRFQVIFKSPLTEILCDSSCSGYWGVQLKQAGYDGLIVEGVSESPVYLLINDDQVELRDATHLAGLDTFATQERVRQEVGDTKAKVLSIGEAGERQVPYACPVNDDGRVPGRGGSGAVMGSKGVKAIVVRGQAQVELHDPEAFKQLALDINKRNASNPVLHNLRTYGTSWSMDGRWAISDVPVRNWSVASYEALCSKLGGKSLKENFNSKNHPGCYRCTIGCSKWVTIEQEPYQLDAPAAEYESVAALGTMCQVDDLAAVSYANHLCNLYGLDTITCGATIAFAMECYEKGLLTSADTDGLEIRWGDKDVVIRLVQMIGKQEGIGRLLGQGTRKMAEHLGQDALDFAVQVKGLELPMHDARAGFAWASNYATSPRGGCHLHGMTDFYEESEDPIPEWGFTGKFTRLSDEGKAAMTRFAQNWAHLLDSLVICYFSTKLLTPSDFATLLNLATGSTYTAQDMLVIGDRINALHRAFNYRCGIRRQDDTLPARAMTPLAEGFTAGQVPDLERQLQEYYQIRRWEADGKPSQAALQDLDLDFASNDLYS
ncbi:aldehyde ferredoxin oxidoreductase [candidate division KSB3 bacterium]|uniref:Aldehyde ferredoxin oxidoreductase n=1 Tax=candidate division KSB3 bacterium TaxID=2044937 RepID=A0A9D5JUS2_9BACT|nr:aldehyde ferredoxin oxidoreductase [candidate division KSB3 bacterium]MBD3324505.1 aldehyde ferredoxin oxidoreductase [candidate division KSB3 bacterium]